jgi:putative ABC transport system ATP-binding protein
MSELAVDVRGVTKVFGTGPLAFRALKGVDLPITRGEFMMLSGPSGSGKTTLLSILGCVLGATEGRVSLFGEEITALPASELPRLRLSYVGFVFQGHNLIGSLSSSENIELVLAMRGWSRKEARQEAHRLLERVGLSHRREARPEDLSGGQRQRVAVARALAGSPPLILADEPTASLDAESGMLVTQLLRDLARQGDHTVAIVTHDNRIFHLADRIVHIEDGRLLPEPTP